MGNKHSASASAPRVEGHFSRIADMYHSVDQVTEALERAGLESSNLIVAIDFTKSNEWQGKKLYHNRSLHYISDSPNPYEQAISIIGQTLSKFDDDNLIPCYGFGDASTRDQDVFCFKPDDKPCIGFAEALARYRELAPQVRLSGPTSFAPAIEMAMTVVERSGGQYHVLVVIADGQVGGTADTGRGYLSVQERKTVDAIVKASQFPLSIVLVGVGDGPWDMMKEFDDKIPARSFDNFQFVNFTETASRGATPQQRDAAFALAALMEVPSQYKATVKLGLLGRQVVSPRRVPLPPPVSTSTLHSLVLPYHGFEKVQCATPPAWNHGAGTAPAAAPTASYQSYSASSSLIPPSAPVGAAPGVPYADNADSQVCPICLVAPKDLAFGCGHQTCRDCGSTLQLCPICRASIQSRIKLY